MDVLAAWVDSTREQCMQASAFATKIRDTPMLAAWKAALLTYRANQASNKHSAKLTLYPSVQKLTCVHRAQINSE